MASLLAAFVLASCGSSPAASPSSKSTTTATSKSGSKSRAPAVTEVRRASSCYPSSLRSSIVNQGAAGGTDTLVISLRNVSHRTCELVGYPDVQMLRGSRHIPITLVRSTNPLGSVSRLRVTPVVVPKNAHAFLLLSYGNVSGTGGNKGCVFMNSLEISVPGHRGWVPIWKGVEAPICDQGVFVSPFTTRDPLPNTR
jgi:hypothetical protein